MQNLDGLYFSLLRIALNVTTESCLPRALSDDEWRWVHDYSVKQCLVGVLFRAVEKLPHDQRPPRELLLRWSFESHKIQLVNERMNKTAADLTEMFCGRGLHPVILKGQANTLLYPDPFCRQAGDIDILLEGGREGVLRTLTEMNLHVDAEDDVSDHHVHLEPGLFGGITVEVHFCPTSSFSPYKTIAMLRFLDGELEELRSCADCSSWKVAQGFCVPSIPFALVMQLSHLRQHFFSTGVGLRQLVDYHQLLKNSTEEDRVRVSKMLGEFGLFHMAGAVMWLMREVFGLGENQLLCPVDKKRGKKLLNVVMNGGNFGRYAADYRVPVLKRWIIDRKRFIWLLKFDATEAIWHELRYWKTTISLIPRRIRRGRVALGNR